MCLRSSSRVITKLLPRRVYREVFVMFIMCVIMCLQLSLCRPRQPTHTAPVLQSSPIGRYRSQS